MKKKKKPHKKRTPAKKPAPSPGGPPAEPAEDRLRQLLSRLPQDAQLRKQADLGLSQQTCRVCGAEGMFQTWRGKELFQRTLDEFKYFVCGHCDCLQIEAVPEDLGKYYAGEYYSYATPEIAKPPPGTELKDDFILDVGCGGGFWLCEQAKRGYQNLFGCDPFNQEDLYYNNGVQIRKCTIHEMFGQFDLIRMGDSFEHVTDPHETMQSIKRLLKPGGEAELHLPIYPNTAFDVYGPYWYGMDPPRHIFLHSYKSLQLLAEHSGLQIKSACTDNSYWQYAISRLYQMGFPFPIAGIDKALQANLSEEEIALMRLTSSLAHQLQRDDHAVVQLQHSA